VKNFSRILGNKKVFFKTGLVGILRGRINFSICFKIKISQFKFNSKTKTKMEQKWKAEALARAKEAEEKASDHLKNYVQEKAKEFRMTEDEIYSLWGFPPLRQSILRGLPLIPKETFTIEFRGRVHFPGKGSKLSLKFNLFGRVSALAFTVQNRRINPPRCHRRH
jgi:hypothetical protein